MKLERYLDRIGLAMSPAITPAGLTTLQAAHRRAIGFENLDIPLGRGIRIDSDNVFDKLVTRGRGGYCFEQNRLFADMLTAVGITCRPFLARVRLNAPEGTVPPRTHVGLLAELDGQAWLADAGFGGSDLPPLPLKNGAEAWTPDGARHRLVKLGSAHEPGGEWRLDRAGPAAATDGRGADHGGWHPQYSFDCIHVAPDDLEQANHWTSTRPGTRFTSLHVASIVLPQGFATMTERALTIHRDGVTQTHVVEDAAAYVRILDDVFRIALRVEEARSLPLFGGAEKRFPTTV